MLVSAIEKKDTSSSDTTSPATSTLDRMVSTRPDASALLAPAQQDFQHEFAAGVADQQQHRAGNDPSERLAPAPAPTPAAGEQHTEEHPGEHRKQGLVIEAGWFAEQGFRKDHPGAECGGQQQKADADQPEQPALQREHWRRGARCRRES